MLSSTSIVKHNTVTYFNIYNKSITYNLKRLGECSKPNDKGKIDSLLLIEFSAQEWVTLHQLCQMAYLIKRTYDNLPWDLEEQVFKLEISRNRNVYHKLYNNRVPGIFYNYGDFLNDDTFYLQQGEYERFIQNLIMPTINDQINN